jgi:hypothetical protein
MSRAVSYAKVIIELEPAPIATGRSLRPSLGIASRELLISRDGGFKREMHLPLWQIFREQLPDAVPFVDDAGPATEHAGMSTIKFADAAPVDYDIRAASNSRRRAKLDNRCRAGLLP